MKDRDRYGAFMGAAMSGDRAIQRAVAAEVTKDEMALRIRALGGAESDVEEALALVRAKLEASQERPSLYTVEDACDEVLRPWMTGEKRPAAPPSKRGNSMKVARALRRRARRAPK